MRRLATRGIVATRTLASAVNDSGDAAVVYSRCLDKQCSTRTVLATFRRRGHDFASPIVLAGRTGYPAAAVALNAHGDAIVAWSQHRARRNGNDIRTRMHRVNGTLTKLRIAGPSAPAPTIAVTLTPGRHGVVSWTNRPVNEGTVVGPFNVSAVDLDSRGTLHAPYTLDAGTPPGQRRPDVMPGARLRAILGADGATTFAWTAFADGHFAVWAARVDRQVEQAQRLSPAGVDAQLMDLASDTAGDAVAVWATVPGRTTAPAVAAAIRRTPATTFDPSQLVLTGAGASGSAVGAVAPNGRALVAAGPEPVLNPSSPPEVQVTQLLG